MFDPGCCPALDIFDLAYIGTGYMGSIRGRHTLARALLKSVVELEGGQRWEHPALILKMSRVVRKPAFLHMRKQRRRSASLFSLHG